MKDVQNGSYLSKKEDRQLKCHQKQEKFEKYKTNKKLLLMK